MIQLANDPSASRTNYRPAASAGKAVVAQRGRTGHAWPFLSRQVVRPAQQEKQKPVASDSGS